MASPPPADTATPPPPVEGSGFTGPPPRLTRTPGAGPPRLRLVQPQAQVRPSVVLDGGHPIRGTADPRWVLAVRAAEQLDGSTLTPPARNRLVRLARAFGLTAFDANLIIAIVQDQARRGYAPAYCPTAGEPQLRMVPLPPRRAWPTRNLRRIGVIFGVLLTAEIAALLWWQLYS